MHGSILEVRNISPWEYSRVSARFRCGGSVSSVQVRRFLLALDYVFPRSAWKFPRKCTRVLVRCASGSARVTAPEVFAKIACGPTQPYGSRRLALTRATAGSRARPRPSGSGPRRRRSSERRSTRRVRRAAPLFFSAHFFTKEFIGFCSGKMLYGNVARRHVRLTKSI